MSPRLSLLTIAAALLTSACIGPVFGADCRARGDLEETISTDGVRRVEVIAYAGDLRITGLSGADQVVARGRVCAGSDRRLAEIELEVSRRGETVLVEAVIPDSNGWSRRDQAWVDLAVSLPDHLAVMVEDGSGDAEVSGVASLKIDDGSGDIELTDIKGDALIVDGSGDVDGRNIGGTVSVDDGSGDVELIGVGDVIVESDGSGDLRFRDVSTDVRVHSDGSGNIRVTGAGGDVIVERDGSGDIDVIDVAGRIQTPD